MSASVTDPEGFEGIGIEYSNQPALVIGAGFMGISIEQGTGATLFLGQGFSGISIEVDRFFIYRIRIVNVGTLGVSNPVITDVSLHHPSETTPILIAYDNVYNEAIINQSFGYGADDFTVSFTITFDSPNGQIIQYYQDQTPEIVFGN